MNERLTDEGIEHLQAAARELISAARVFLDVVEDLVEQPDRVTQSLSGVVDMFKEIAGRPTQPWETHAWNTSESDGRARSRGARRNDDDDQSAGPDHRRTDDEPTLFQTASGTAADGVNAEEASDWAVWDDDEDPSAHSVVDIRSAGERPADTGATASKARRPKKVAAPTTKSKRSTVKRITVD